ncbi:MAG: AraC family transcriptional regulator [Synergistaceae bacterium]|jgi:AraC-like DNA-binding protein|nr:AraC family transcriptional regulator [Synergistaceae bacterium]
MKSWPEYETKGIDGTAASLGALEGCDGEADGFIRRISFENKFFIEQMDYRFIRRASKRYCTNIRFLEIINLESIKAVNKVRGGGELPIDAGVNVNLNQGGAGELVFFPDVPVRGIRIVMDENFYASHLGARFPGNPIDAAKLGRLNNINFREPETQFVFGQIKHGVERGIDSEMYFESKVTELLYLIITRDDPSLPQALKRRRLTREDLAAVKKVKDIIEERLSNSPKISELAITSGTSAVKLQNDFKTAFGSTIHGYVQKVRMTAALSKIEYTDEPLYVIAQSVGCKNPGRFSEIFKKTYGMTPLDYRNSKNRGPKGC